MPRKLTSLLSLMLALSGALGASSCSSSQLLAGRRVAPTVVVEASYPGASAAVVADTVAAPLEQELYTVEYLRYVLSRCERDGTCSVAVVFSPGVDLKLSQVVVQNRINLALPRLPDLVKRRELRVPREGAGVLLFVSVFSPQRRYDTLYLSNYARIQLADELARVPGVARVASVGQQDYSLRIWLDPDKLAARSLTAADVVKALEKQQALALPSPVDKSAAAKEAGAVLEVRTLSRLVDISQCEKIVVKTDDAGQEVQLQDVARIEFGAAGPESHARLDGQQVVLLGLHAFAEVRPQELSAAVRKKVAQLQANAPDGLRIDVAFDFTPNWEAPDRPTTPGCVLVDVDMPASASVERTVQVLTRCDDLLRRVEGVRAVLAMTDNPFDRVRDRPCLLVRFEPAGGREALLQAVRTRLNEIQEAGVRLRDLSGPGGFPACDYPLHIALHGPEQDRVRQWAEKLAERLRREKQLTDVWANPESAPRPQLIVDIDRDKVKVLGLSLDDVLKTLQVYSGETRISNVPRAGRTWQVQVAAATEGRTVEDLKQLKIRNAKGDMVPLGTVVALRDVTGPLVLTRLDGRPMVDVTANPASGVSPADARARCEAAANEVRRELQLPEAYRLTWLREPRPR